MGQTNHLARLKKETLYLRIEIWFANGK